MTELLINGNALHIPLADESVHCVVTSPPYWGLRDYGTAEWEGGNPGCDHVERKARQDFETLPRPKGGHNQDPDYIQYQKICAKCGAIRKDKQLGLEPTPEEYIANMVAVFREVWRVLRADGVVWLNLGDSYNGSGGAGGDYNMGGLKEGQPKFPGRNAINLKPKDLVGIPWRVALALQDDGWWLRSDIIWSKPNPMPESVRDRPTKSHEYLFLLTKSARYFYDQDAVREESQMRDDVSWRIKYGGYQARIESKVYSKSEGDGKPDFITSGERYWPTSRNRRTVWEIPTHPYPGSHFATYPPALVEPCIKAGTSERGVCPICGAPWERVTTQKEYAPARSGEWKATGENHRNDIERKGGFYPETTTTGWRPTCAHDAEPVPAVILDPFVGSGTTLMVARQLGRNSIGIDLSYPYLHDQARARLELDALEAWEMGESRKDGASVTDLPLFAEPLDSRDGEG